QEQSFTPVGSNRNVQVDVRIIAASHKPFEEMIKNKEFREDLFYRLNVLPVYLPPLRERKSDIPYLVNYYLNYFNSHHHMDIDAVSDEAIEILKNYSWPGNIRELRNVIEHAFIIETGSEIKVSALPANVLNGPKAEEVSSNEESEVQIDVKEIQNSILDNTPSTTISSGYSFSFAADVDENDQMRLDFQEAKDIFEKEFIIYALKLNTGKINQTALKANIPKKTLLRKIEKYEINPKDFY
ncbi:MAG: sigma 54-interacting transcriptional regulator, partial [Bacteriovoracaceae bacterium]